MSDFEIIMPKLGESVQEATITRWLVKEGDMVEEDQALLEIATDKVDSEIPSPVEGRVTKILYEEDSLVPVGKVVAVINLDGEEASTSETTTATEQPTAPTENHATPASEASLVKNSESDKFYSPLVRTIAAQENITEQELDSIVGSGIAGRVQKQDVLNFLQNRKASPDPTASTAPSAPDQQSTPSPKAPEKPKVSVSVNAGDEIVAMDRMRKLIAQHMVDSVQTSPHVTSMVEADVTDVVLWRNKIKGDFEKREKEKITFLPIFIEAMAKALKEFPQVNASTDGENIILRKAVNIGIAVALPDGNLIVPVIKNADQLNLLGITKEMNRLANAARNNQLKPDEIDGGTFSVSNFGSFKNVMGTPIINQPQVAIMAVGTIEKKPAVVELPTGDIIAVRHKMFLSLSYDHRVVDGALGGAFLRRVADIIEAFDPEREV
jgi:2-oxoglutarate dehydrogenase E2 component (dihydrolipoamide succinyltransferase)